MNDRDTLELIQQEIDGENGPEQTARLRKRLTADPDARDLFEDFAGIASELDSLAVLDPPPGITAKVVEKIRGAQDVPIHAAPPPARARNGADRRWIARTIYAAAAGVVIVLFFAPLVLDRRADRPSFDWRDASGSMVRHSDLLVEKEIVGSSVRGSVELRRQGDRIAVVLDLESAASYELELRFDPRRLAFEGHHRRNSSDGPLSNSPGVVTILSTGTETATVVLWRLVPDAGAIALSIRTGRETIETTLPTSDGPG